MSVPIRARRSAERAAGFGGISVRQIGHRRVAAATSESSRHSTSVCGRQTTVPGARSPRRQPSELALVRASSAGHRQGRRGRPAHAISAASAALGHGGSIIRSAASAAAAKNCARPAPAKISPR
ncbi:MAG: hypothetical protein MZV65_53615 [Chromatiales bacterium]|nr:hypothetical protein [Chromatiales bacterium]